MTGLAASVNAIRPCHGLNADYIKVERL